jgi:glutaredoxin
MNVIVWSKLNCPYCVSAKELLTRLNVKFEERVVGVDYTKEQFFEANPGATTVPQIYIQNEHIGGYDRLVEYVENTGFNGTGHTL